MSIALPLTDDAYEAVRRGERKTYRCKPADLLPASPQLLVEGLALRPPEEAPEAERQDLRLVVAMLCQHAHLTDYPGVGREIPLRLLAFAGTPKHRERALKFKYRPTGTFMHGTNIEFLERRLFLPEKGGLDWGVLGIWEGLQSFTRRATHETLTSVTPATDPVPATSQP